MIADHVKTLAERCISQSKMVACVESCSGGMLAAVCTDLAGSSAWFERGWVTYSNAAKMDCVGVTAATLETYGAVSEATAREMAVGGVVHSRAHVCVSITGVAGPSGGTAQKPVGMVCFGIAVRGGSVQTQTQYFAGDRVAVRTEAVAHALKLLVEAIG